MWEGGEGGDLCHDLLGARKEQDIDLYTLADDEETLTLFSSVGVMIVEQFIGELSGRGRAGVDGTVPRFSEG